jgi:GPH family glycoside/pentoside/hexuronide:cation symporter
MELQKMFPNYFNAPIDWEAINDEKLQSLFRENFEKGMHGICFSPFREGQNPGNPIFEDQIRARLEILKPHTQWIRAFSCTNGHEKIPAIAKEMGFKVLMGAWISEDEEQNNREIKSLIKLIESGKVDMASVGNEVLYRGELNESKIIKYIQHIKDHSNGVPVGYVEVYYEFINRPKLVEACDVVMINCYPFWEGSDIEHASLYLQEMYRKTAESVGNKRIIIAETGWPSKGNVINVAIPSKENTMKYYLDIQSWAQHSGVDLFYFSSFDESWKIHQEGWAGTSWGLWDKNEKFKY